MLRTAYEREKEDFDVAHGMMVGGRISYAMLCNAKADFDNRWKRIVGDWFVSTARSEDERKLMREYGVGVADLKYERAELVAVMRGWESVRGSRGMFLGNDLTFTIGTGDLVCAVQGRIAEELRAVQTWVWRLIRSALSLRAG